MRTVTEPLPEIGRVLEKWIRCLSFGRKLQTLTSSSLSKGKLWFQTFFVTDDGINRSGKESGFISSLTPATRSLCSSQNDKETYEQKVEKQIKSQAVTRHSSHFSVLWTELQTSYLEVLLTKVPLNFTRICDCISKQWEIIALSSVTHNVTHNHKRL